MSKTTHCVPVNRVKARHANAIPYKRERWDAKRELANAQYEVRK